MQSYCSTACHTCCSTFLAHHELESKFIIIHFIVIIIIIIITGITIVIININLIMIIIIITIVILIPVAGCQAEGERNDCQGQEGEAAPQAPCRVHGPAQEGSCHLLWLQRFHAGHSAGHV